MTRYTILLWLGRPQAWLAQTWRASESGWVRALTLAAWVPSRAVFCFAYWLVVPRG